MKTKTKNNKVQKSAKTRLSDLTPKKDTRGGKYVAGPAPTPPIKYPVSTPKKQYTL
jgi:hypothetical protein